MKNVVLFAVVGASLNLITSLFWLVAHFMGYERLNGILPAMQLVGCISGVVFALSAFTFFMVLYKRQK